MQTIILSRDMLSLLEKHSRSGDFEENYCVDTGCEIDVGSDSYAEGKSHILWDCRERFTRLLSPPWWPSWGRQEATGRARDAPMHFASQALGNRYRFAWKST